MKTSRAKNTLLNTAAGVATKVTTMLAGFVMRSVFIHFLGIQYAGVSGLFTDILSALSLAELGISTAITYAMYKPVADGDSKQIAMLMDVYKKAYRIVAGIVLAAGLALVPFLGYFVKDVPDIKENITLIYILYVVNSAVSYLLVYKTTLLTAHQEHRYVSLVQTIIGIVKVIVGCLILFLFRSFIAYLIAELVLTRLQNVITSWYAGKRYPEANQKPETPLPKEERQKIFKDVRALMLYKISQALLRSVDSVIVSAMFGTAWVGMMGNYSMITKRVNNLINQFYDSASPSIGNLSAESDADKKYRTFRVLQFMAFWMCCFCFTSFVVLFNPFIELWLGSKYVMGMQVVLIMSFVFYINSVVHPVTTFRTANGLFVKGKYRPVVMLFLNAGLSVLLAWEFRADPEWGIFGVKAATALAQLLTLHWYDPWLVYKNVFNRKVRTYFVTVTMQLLLTFAVCAVTYGIGELLPIGNKYLLFAAKVGLCAVIPNLTVFLIFRRKNEFREFMRILKEILSGKKKKKTATKSISAA